MQCTLSTLTSIRLAQLSRMWTILASIVWVVLALFYALEILCTHKSFHTFMPFSDCSAFQKSSFPFPFVNSYFKTHLGQDDLSVQDDSHSVMSNSLGPHGLQHTRFLCPSPSPAAHSLMSIESVMLSNHLLLCRPLLLPPSIFPSIRVFSNESVLPIRWPKYWSFSFSISPSNEYSGLISFRMD